MRFIILFLLSTLLFPSYEAFAGTCGSPGSPCCKKDCRYESCCGGMGGINYCDSTAGRLVCNNGYYSSCYCTTHAVMDLQLLKGCCLWRGGIMAIDALGVVVCRDGSISEECTTSNQTHVSGQW